MSDFQVAVILALVYLWFKSTYGYGFIGWIKEVRRLNRAELRREKEHADSSKESGRAA